MFTFTITPFIMRRPNFNVRWCSKHKLPTIDVDQFSYHLNDNTTPNPNYCFKISEYKPNCNKKNVGFGRKKRVVGLKHRVFITVR